MNALWFLLSVSLLFGLAPSVVDFKIASLDGVSKVSIGVIAGCVTGIFRAPAGKMVLCWYQRLHSTGFGVLFVGVAFLGSPCFGSFVDWVGGGARWFSGGL